MSEEAKEIARILTDHPDLIEQTLSLVIEQAIKNGIPMDVCQQVLQS